MARDVGELFRQRPPQWGLRGDPHVWDRIARILRGESLPQTEAELRTMIAAAFVQATGRDMDSGDRFAVDGLPKDGLSGGMVSARAWRETILPFVLGQFRALRD